MKRGRFTFLLFIAIISALLSGCGSVERDETAALEAESVENALNTEETALKPEEETSTEAEETAFTDEKAEEILNNEPGLWTDFKESDRFPSYHFFSWQNQYSYDINLLMRPAEVILAYAEDDSEEDTWEFRCMRNRHDEHHRDTLSFFVCSDEGRELYMLFDETREAGPQYLVMADVMPGQDGTYSHESALYWTSYQDMLDSREQYAGYSIYIDEDAYIYDSVYIDEGACAMADYLDTVQADKEAEWRLLEHLIYIGKNGYLADMWFSDGFQRAHIIVDIRDKQYSVVELYDEQDETDYVNPEDDPVTALELQGDWKDLYDVETGEGYFINAGEWHYDSDLENAAAAIVKTYSEKKGMADEEWKLLHIYSENGIKSIFVRSEMDKGLIILIKDDEWKLIADIQTGDAGQYEVNGWSYDSGLKWGSYEAWAQGEADFDYTICRYSKYDQYDSIYCDQSWYAMQAYLSSIHADEQEEWTIEYERLFVAPSGCLADVWYTGSGDHRVHLVIDTSGKLYTVIAA